MTNPFSALQARLAADGLVSEPAIIGANTRIQFAIGVLVAVKLGTGNAKVDGVVCETQVVKAWDVMGLDGEVITIAVPGPRWFGWDSGLPNTGDVVSCCWAPKPGGSMTDTGFAYLMGEAAAVATHDQLKAMVEPSRTSVSVVVSDEPDF